LAAGYFLRLLVRAKASTRYVVALGALLLMAALPFATALGLAGGSTAPVLPAAAAARPSGPSQPIAVAPGAVPSARTFGAALLPWVLGLWLAGVAGLSLYHLAGWRWMRRLSRQSLPVGKTVFAVAQQLCHRLRIGRAVAFLESSAVSVPMVVGWLRPAVLIPASALTGLSPQQLEAILAHELAHVRRHDYVVNLFQTAIETLLFYHPAVWWISAQIRRERENCCDDLAVAVCGDRLGYARALVDLEGLRSAPQLALAATGGSLSDRVRRLVGAPRRPARRSWAAGLVALTLLPVGAAVQLACHHREAAQQTASLGLRGTWSAERQGQEMRLVVSLHKAGWGTWTLSDDYPASEFAGLSAGSDRRFELRRDAGTLRFQGSFDGRQGRGAFTFTPNPAFAQATGSQAGDVRLVQLALQDVSFDFVRQVKELGVAGGPRPFREPWKNHGVFHFVHQVLGIEKPESFADRLSQLRTHRITPEYIRGMTAAGYPHLPLWQLVDLQDHGIEPAYVQGLRDSGYRHLLPFRIIALHDHGITADWLRGIVDAGFADIPPDQLISLHDHGIDGDFVRKARAAGYARAQPEELISLRDRGKV
jgi:beta-lactamase regulating signal transducer with metallopeptidase domain